jgi:RNA polymerase sigma factor (sigma-70 family)
VSVVAEAHFDPAGEELLPPIRLRAEPSYEAFFRNEYRGLVALAYALTGFREGAEDLAQDAFLVAFRRWEQVAQLDRPEAWVRRTCANLATSWRRRKGAEFRAMARLGSRRGDDTPTRDAGAMDDDEVFWAHVRRLPRRQAQCIALRYVYSCPVAEIAETLECTEGSVKQHLARAKARLQADLGEAAS